MLKLGTTNIKLPFSKAYLGSLLKYQKIVNTEFTACPFPTTWTEVTANTEYTATNDFGTWRIWADNCYSKSRSVVNAFDNDGETATYYQPETLSSGVKTYMGIDLPNGVAIKPTQIILYARVLGNVDETGAIEALSENGEWEVIFNLPRLSNSASEQIIDISNNKFYSKFRLKMTRYSSNSNRPNIFNFQITSGTIREKK